jgi:hypothetical protein
MPNPDEAPSHEGDADDIGQPIATMSRLSAVMHLAWKSDDRAAYFKSDDLCPIALPWPTWTDMGSPQAITVTITPGDALN